MDLYHIIFLIMISILQMRIKTWVSFLTRNYHLKHILMRKSIKQILFLGLSAEHSLFLIILHLFSKAFVRPHLEFSNCVWSPYKKKHIDQLENIQRRATRLVPSLHGLSYPERLMALNLPTLTYRRARGDMIEVYKIVTNMYDRRVSNLFKFRFDARTRGS